MAGKASREIETSCETIESIEADPYDKECPMVFYCNKCSAIIGDSFSWLCVNKGIQAVVLQTVTDKVIECDELFMSPSGPDKGSTFVNLRCSGCSENIGRMYKSTAPHLDELRNVYNLYAPKIDSYIIGSAKVTNLDLKKEDGSKVAYCFSQIRKLQQVIVEFNNRMTVIEEHLDIENSFRRSENHDATDDECHKTGCKSETSAGTLSKHNENAHSFKRKTMESFKDEKLLWKKNKLH